MYLLASVVAYACFCALDANDGRRPWWILNAFLGLLWFISLPVLLTVILRRWRFAYKNRHEWE